ncbi:hypothetical protein [Lichenifustis flavocetrariae]|uniref:Uncharacterized protein n=1 Tax=Lichenifustis flavocetrariae TaxID=2949735 RepID=A0AA42CL67_9HYPH|nr:hypothetical protein [Lichenifustis flavocetrariae]MCW6507067.1 hypothetical protein [Lichenifustis flavocetrariae]
MTEDYQQVDEESEYPVPDDDIVRRARYVPVDPTSRTSGLYIEAIAAFDIVWSAVDASAFNLDTPLTTFIVYGDERYRINTEQGGELSGWQSETMPVSAVLASAKWAIANPVPVALSLLRAGQPSD